MGRQGNTWSQPCSIPAWNPGEHFVHLTKSCLQHPVGMANCVDTDLQRHSFETSVPWCHAWSGPWTSDP